MENNYDDLAHELENVRERLESSDGEPEELVSKKEELHARLRRHFIKSENKDKETVVSELNEKITLATESIDSASSKHELYKHFVSIRTIRNNLERRGFKDDIINKANNIEDSIRDEMYSISEEK